MSKPVTIAATLTQAEGAALLGAIREYGLNCAKRQRLKNIGRDMVEFWGDQEIFASALEAKLFPKAQR